MWRPSHFVVLCNDQRRDVLFLNLLYQSVCWFTIALEHVLILKKGESRTEAYIFDSRSGHFFFPFHVDILNVQRVKVSIPVQYFLRLALAVAAPHRQKADQRRLHWLPQRWKELNHQHPPLQESV